MTKNAAGAKSQGEEGKASEVISLDDPETGTGGGITGKLAEMTQSVPLIGGLGDLSLGLALRWLLWLAAVLLSFVGLALVVVGAGGGVLALGSLSAAVTPVLTDAGAGVESAALSVDASGTMVANFTDAASSSALSLSSLSTGLNQTASNLDSLSALSRVPGMSALDFSASAISLRAASSQLGSTISAAQAGSLAGTQVGANLAQAGGKMHAIASDLNNAKAQVNAGIFWMQMGVLAFGAAIGAMLAGVLMLALAYGPPKK